MSSIEEYIQDITPILNNGPLAFKLTIIIGVLLIIIAVVPSLSISFLKIPSLTLSKNQSKALATIGCILILGGLVGFSQMSNEPPIIKEITISPDIRNAIASPEGTEVKINVVAEDPDANNLILKAFADVTPLQYVFFVQSPSTNYTTERIHGPDMQNYTDWLIFPSCAGKNIIVVNVTDMPTAENAKYTRGEYIYLVKCPNKQPIIENVYSDKGDPQPVNSRIMITAEAKDQEGDTIYYQFLRMPPNDTDFSITQRDWNISNDIFWRPTEDDIGENRIRVNVRDAFHPIGENQNHYDIVYNIIGS